VDNAGNLYVSEQGNFDIRKITPGGTVTTFAGTAGGWASRTARAVPRSFNLPAGLAVDANGNVYVADYANNTIRKITPAGVVTTLAGKLAGLRQRGRPGRQRKVLSSGRHRR